MTNELKAQIALTADAEGVEVGVGKAKRSIASLGQAAAQAGKAGADGLSGIGTGSEEASKKVDRATQNLVTSIQRTIAATEAGDRSNRKYFEYLANQRGANTDVLKPYLAQLDEVNARTRTLGVSAGQTTQALRQLPAQFTDIVTSLQAGQAPLTVLLQQGGQIKDSFGGAGLAAQALGRYLVGLVNPYVLLGGAVLGVVAAYTAGQKEAENYNRAIILSGNASGTSAGQLQAYAKSISAVVGTQSAAAEAIALVAQSGSVASANLEKFTQSALIFEKATGQAVGETVKQFEELGKSPLEASIKLNERYNFLTTSVYEQIKALQEQGKATEAAALAQKTYSDTLSSRGTQILENIGYIEQAWNAVTGAIKGAISAAKQIGRETTVQDQIAVLQEQIQRREERNANLGIAGGEATRQLQAQLAALQATAFAQQANAEAIAAGNAQLKARIQFEKEGEKFVSKQVQLEQEIVRQRNLGLAAGKSEAEIQTRIAEVRRDFNKSQGSNGQTELANLRARVLEETNYIAALQARGAEADKLTEGERRSLQLQEQLKGSLTGKVRVQKELELAAARELASLQQQSRAINDRIKLDAELKQQQDKQVDAAFKAAESIAAQALAQERANETFGLGKSAITELTLAQQRKSLADLEATDNVIPGYIEALKQQIKETERLAAAQRNDESLDANKKASDAATKAAKKAADDWERASEQINQSLTDALLRGFESGKGLLENFVDTIRNLFKTLVLRPIISAVISPITGAATSAFGIPGVANAAGSAPGLGNTLGLVSNLSTAYSALTGSFISSIGSAAISAGNLFGSTAIAEFGLGLKGFQTFAALEGGVTGALGAGASTGSALSSVASVAPYALAAVAVLNALGVFRSTRVTDVGITGSLGQQSNVQGFTEIRRGGTLFSGPSYRDELAALPADIDASIKQAVASVYQGVEDYAAALNLNTDALATYTQDIRVSTKDLTSEQIEAKLQEEFAKFGEGLAATLSPQFAAVARAGESAGETLTRLSGSLQVVNTSFDLFGFKLLDASVAGADAASKFVDAFGGIEAYLQTSSSFYQNYFTEGERTAKLTEQLTEQFAALGFALPASRQGLRDLVEQQLSLGDSALPTVASLLKLESSFASITPKIEDAAGSIQRLFDFNQERNVVTQVTRELSTAERLLGAERRDQLDATRRLAEESKAALAAFGRTGQGANAFAGNIAIATNDVPRDQQFGIAKNAIGQLVRELTLDFINVNDLEARRRELLAIGSIYEAIGQQQTNIALTTQDGLGALVGGIRAAAARELNALATDPAFDLGEIASRAGQAFSAFSNDVTNLNSQLASGAISQDQYAEAIAQVNEYAKLANVDQRGYVETLQLATSAYQSATRQLVTVGYAFEQIANEASKLTGPGGSLEALTNQLGQLRSINSVFGANAKDSPESKAVSTAADSVYGAIVASLPGLGAQGELSATSFGGLDVAALAALGSVTQGNAQSLRDAFIVLSDQLGKGKISLATYESAISSANSTFSGAAAQAQQAAQQIASAAVSQSEALQAELFALLDTEEEALARKREAVYESNLALYDLVEGLKAAKVAEEARAARLAQVASQAESLDTRLLQLQGNTAALRERELAAQFEENRAKLQAIFALEDQTAAAQAAAQAQERLVAATERFTAASSAVGDAQRNLASFGEDLAAQINQIREQASQELNQSRGGVVSALDALGQASESASERLTAAQSQASTQLRDTMRQVAGSVGDYLRELAGTAAGSDTIQQRRGFSATRFNSLADRALTGDTQAGTEVAAAARQYIEDVRATAGSALEFQREELRVRVLLAQLQQQNTVAIGDVTDTTDTLATAQAEAEAAATAYANAVLQAAAAGVTYTVSAESASVRFDSAITSFSEAQARFNAVQGQLASEEAGLVSRYGDLTAQLSEFQTRTGTLLDGLAPLDPLGDLLTVYSDAVKTLLDATQERAAALAAVGQNAPTSLLPVSSPPPQQQPAVVVPGQVESLMGLSTDGPAARAEAVGLAVMELFKLARTELQQIAVNTGKTERSLSNITGRGRNSLRVSVVETEVDAL